MLLWRPAFELNEYRQLMLLLAGRGVSLMA